MFIDTSALIAIFLGEPEANRLADAIERAAKPITSPLVRLETCMALSTRADIAPLQAQKLFDALIQEANIGIVDVDDSIGMLAVAAFEKFGKGRRNKAALNLADCMSYACARAHKVPILFIGRDFENTDLEIALRLR